MIDMFATASNTKLPQYVSPIPDPKAWKIDALSIPWEGLDGYAFCPVAILQKLIQKMNTYPCRMIVIAPGWPAMSWFWDLIELSSQPPLSLPLWKNLLTQPHSQYYHQNLPYLNLHAWLLDTRLPPTPLKWRAELRLLRGNHQEGSTQQGGPYMGTGAMRTRWISPIPLFPK